MSKKSNLLALGMGVLLCGVVVGGAELLLRFTTDIPRLGGDKGLFNRGEQNAEGYGLSKNARGVFYGEMTYTDGYGYRISRAEFEEGQQPITESDRILLVMGDSVAFGNSVAEPDSLAGLLKKQTTDLRVVNVAVPGYDLKDYVDALDRMPFDMRQVERVILVYCLNDIYYKTSSELQDTLKQGATADNRGAIEKLADTLKNSSFHTIHKQLRRHSVLYLWLRDALNDQQMRYWNAIDKLYDENNPDLVGNFRHLETIQQRLAEQGAPLTVLLTPYAVQMREGMTDSTGPQDWLSSQLEAAGIDYIDLLPGFLASEAPTTLFLATDPMHLSRSGHRLVAQRVRSILE